MTTCAARKSAVCSSSRCLFSSSSRAELIASASSRATDSTSEISASDHGPAAERWRPRTPIGCSRAIIGVAIRDFVPRRSSMSVVPPSGSSSSESFSTSETTIVRPSAAARLAAGRFCVCGPIGCRPVSNHSAARRWGSSGWPRRMTQREARSARPTSVTATRVPSASPSTERTRLEMSPTSRSRARASSRAPADRVRSSASAASDASDCISVTSSLEKARFADVGAATSTPTTLWSTISGTKAPLLAPTASTSRRLTS